MIKDIFSWSVKHKQLLINFFLTGYIMVLVFLAVAYYFTLKDILPLLLYSLAVGSGKGALIVLAITALPGIARRLTIKHPLFNLLMLFRRQLGVSVYFLVLMHFSILRLFPFLTGGSKALIYPLLFELAGLTAFILLNSLFITSNDYLVRILGLWWQRLHRIVYLIIWLVFFHVLLQSHYPWAALIGLIGLLEIISWGYVVYKRWVTTQIKTNTPKGTPKTQASK